MAHTHTPKLSSTPDSYALALYVLTGGQEGSLPPTPSPGFDVRGYTVRNDELVKQSRHHLYEYAFTAHG